MCLTSLSLYLFDLRSNSVHPTNSVHKVAGTSDFPEGLHFGILRKVLRTMGRVLNGFEVNYVAGIALTMSFDDILSGYYPGRVSSVGLKC